jgi:hypothetical protein
MSDNNSSVGCGGGFPGLLAVLFIGLKLTGYIDWSWWWVLSPIWISIVLAILAIMVFVAIKVATD